MKVDFSKELKDIDGKSLSASKECGVVDPNGKFVTDSDGNKLITIIKTPNEIVTLKKVSIDSLLANAGTGEKVTGEEKSNRYTLAMDINGAKDGKIDLKTDNIKLIKDLIGDNYGPLIVGQAFIMLEGKSK